MLKREHKYIKNKSTQKKNNYQDENVKIGEVFKNIMDITTNNVNVQIPNINYEDNITLDDILNLWDGIRETPGRILIITSNHYNELDPALIRPGRIDISHELKNASRNTIQEMYQHLFEKQINLNQLKKVKEYFYSPAEIINMYISHKKEDDFMRRLIMNKKVE